MHIIKRLHIFILKSFLPVFAMTFFIVLFIVLMQFLWKYVDDLVGKGLEISVLAELFFYAAVSMVPMSLPLAILLASLMTFGNLGEKLELTAMKASGISLLRVMAPLIIFIGSVAVGAFFFQNYVLPKAQVKMWTLLFSVKQKKPDVEIPEGAFYTDIGTFNLYVKEKDAERGMLKNVMIYDVSRGGDNSTILLADSASLNFTPDMTHLFLHLYTGEQFENLRDQSSIDKNVPFRREEFRDKQILIPFDANFNRLDDQTMRKQYVGKNIAELRHTIDSVTARIDSVGATYSKAVRSKDMAGVKTHTDPKTGEPLPYKSVAMPVRIPDIDSLLASKNPQMASHIVSQAIQKTKMLQEEYKFKAMNMETDMMSIRRHEIELVKKFTLSVACLIFFFIGAPLGAIIRKGGLGWPLVISVLLFIIYYIIDNTGYKMARDGRWPVWEGMWISTAVLAPLGVYVTWMAIKDARIFEIDKIRRTLTRMFGKRSPRFIETKEFVINDFFRPEALSDIQVLNDKIVNFMNRYRRPQNYITYFLNGYDMAELQSIISDMEHIVESVSETTDRLIVNKLMDYPEISAEWWYRPTPRKWMSTVMICLFPVGIPTYLIGIYRQKSLKKDLSDSVKTGQALEELISNKESES